MLVKLNNQEKIIDYRKLDFKRHKNFGFEFSDYRSLKELFKGIYYRNISMEEAERIQDEYEAQLNALENYRPRKPDYVEKRKKLLSNAKKKKKKKNMMDY